MNFVIRRFDYPWWIASEGHTSAHVPHSVHISVDRILITFRDCANWAFIDTSTASDTIVTNYVSHCSKS